MEQEKGEVLTREELLQIAKPILFNTEMVRAILEDRKTVTRRICKDGDAYTVPDMGFFDPDKRTYAVHNYCDKSCTYEYKVSIAERKCPICPGDILYVRETWQQGYAVDENGKIFENPGKYIYAASVEHSQRKYIFWKPSIHMPKDAARIFLKVTDVRVERLQNMDRMDAIKEGIDNRLCINLAHALTKFKKLWNSTIKPVDFDRYSWDANPYVWIIELERIQPD